MEGEGIYPGIPLKIDQGVVSPASSFGKNKSAGNSQRAASGAFFCKKPEQAIQCLLRRGTPGENRTHN